MAPSLHIAKTDVFRIQVAVPGNGRAAWDTKPAEFVTMRGGQTWTLKVQRDARERFPFDYRVSVVPPTLPNGSACAFTLYERIGSEDITRKENALIGCDVDREENWLIKARTSSSVHVGAEVTVKYTSGVSPPVETLCARAVRSDCWDFRSSDSMGEFDAALVVQGVRFYAHRAILSSASPVFRGMFTTENRDKYELEHQVAAEDATPEEFDAFLHCVYPCGKEPSEEFLVPIAILADYYGVKPVLSTCITLIDDSNNVIGTFTKEDHRQLMQSDVKEHLGEKRLLKIWEQSTSLL